MSTLQRIHKLTSPLLYRSGIYQSWWRRRSRQAPFSFVLFYHRVVADDDRSAGGFDIERGIGAADFERQMEFLVRHFRPVRASQAQAAIGDDICFAVTLDDGYIDNYEVAAPILKKLGIPATFFVVSDFVASDRLFWWEQVADLMRRCEQPEIDLAAALPALSFADGRPARMPLADAGQRADAYERVCALLRNGPHRELATQLRGLVDYLGLPLRETGRDFGLMDWSQLSRLIDDGFEIGGHTATHSNLVGADDELLEAEIVGSMHRIEAKLGCEIETFAYPYGLFEPGSKAVHRSLAQTRCRAAFTTVQGVVAADQPAFELPRTKFNRSWDFACAFNLQDTLNRSDWRAAGHAT